MTAASRVVKGRTRVTSLALAVSALIVGLGTTPADAFVCAQTQITARGEPSTYEWLAKTKARANWRTRVRATRELGTRYSTWSQAQAKVETCEPAVRGVICTFTAIPCRL
jgi:hypothetical protein